MNYEEWKRLNKSTWQTDIKRVMEFESLYPIDVMKYKKRLANEKEKRSDIAGIKDRSKRLKAISAANKEKGLKNYFEKSKKAVLLYHKKYDILSIGKDHEARRLYPSSIVPEGPYSPPDERKEGDAMYVTYADLFQFCIFICTLVGLCYTIFRGKKK